MRKYRATWLWEKVGDKIVTPLVETIFRSKSPEHQTRETFEDLYELMDKKLTKEDCRKIRSNMIRLADKLYEVYKENVNEVDEELERRQI